MFMTTVVCIWLDFKLNSLSCMIRMIVLCFLWLKKVKHLCPFQSIVGFRLCVHSTELDFIRENYSGITKVNYEVPYGLTEQGKQKKNFI